MAEELQAGPQMDEAILEQVMGYTRYVGEAVPEINRHDGKPVERQMLWGAGESVMEAGCRAALAAGELEGGVGEWLMR